MVNCIETIIMPGECRSVMDRVDKVSSAAVPDVMAVEEKPSVVVALGEVTQSASAVDGREQTADAVREEQTVRTPVGGEKHAEKSSDRAAQDEEEAARPVEALAESQRDAADSALAVSREADTAPPGSAEELEKLEKKKKLLEQLKEIERQQSMLAASRNSNSPSASAAPKPESAGGIDEEGEIRSRRERRARQPSIHARPFPGETAGAASVGGAAGNGISPSALQLSGRPSVPYATSKRFQFCLKLLQSFQKLKDSAPFRAPVNELWPSESIPGYFDIVLKPMDFRTIGEKLYSGEYTRSGSKPPVFDVGRFSFDFRLVFRNAMAYNKPEDKFHMDAKTLLEKFESKLLELPAVDVDASSMAGESAVRQGSKRATPSPSRQHGQSKKRKTASLPRPRGFSDALPSAGASATHSHSGSWGRASTGNGKAGKKSGADSGVAAEAARRLKGSRNIMEEEYSMLNLKDAIRKLAELNRKRMNLASDHPMKIEDLRGSTLYHLPMTVQEKLKLRDNIQKLGDDNLIELLGIVKRRQGMQEVTDEGEVELELDAYSTNTLREMEAFVSSSLHKKKVGPRATSAMPVEELEARIRYVGAVIERLRNSSSAAHSDSMQRRAENMDPYASDSSESDSSGSDSE